MKISLVFLPFLFLVNEAYAEKLPCRVSVSKEIPVSTTSKNKFIATAHYDEKMPCYASDLYLRIDVELTDVRLFTTSYDNEKVGLNGTEDDKTAQKRAEDFANMKLNAFIKPVSMPEYSISIYDSISEKHPNLDPMEIDDLILEGGWYEFYISKQYRVQLVKREIPIFSYSPWEQCIYFAYVPELGQIIDIARGC